MIAFPTSQNAFSTGAAEHTGLASLGDIFAFLVGMVTTIIIAIALQRTRNTLTVITFEISTVAGILHR